jgi:hypothetical protein
MFADFRVHGLNVTFFQCFHRRSTPNYRKRKRRGFAHLIQPMYAKVHEHGAPVQGARLDGKPESRGRNDSRPQIELESFISLLTRPRKLPARDDKGEIRVPMKRCY